MDKVREYIKNEKLLDNEDTILVGLSGGIDSVVLLHFLISIKDEYNLTLFAAHINHSLRGKEADKDEQFVSELCNNYNIILFSEKMDIRKRADEEKISIEEAGRNARYEYFDIICKKHNIRKIALAHHKDDQVETILMRIVRGTGFKGLRGIIPLRDNIIRPFLVIDKDEINLYAHQNKLIYRQDQSNFDLLYNRNKIRLELMPMMSQLNSNFKENILHIGSISRDYYDFLQNEIEKNWPDIVYNNRIYVNSFNKLNVALKREVLLKWCDCVKDMGFSHVEIVLNKLNEVSDTTWSIDLPDGYKLKRKYEFLYLEQNAEVSIQSYSYTVFASKAYCFPKINMIIDLKIVSDEMIKKIEKNRFVAYFDYDKIKILGTPMVLRNKIDGDKIASIGMTGTKKIKDIFIDRKIPADERWRVPLLTVNEEIIWVLGYNKSRKFTIDYDTTHVLMISFKYIKEENPRCIRI